MPGINKINISAVGDLIAQKGDFQLFERVVKRENKSPYRILTSFRNGQPFKQIIKGRDLEYKDCYYFCDDKYYRYNKGKGLRFIPPKIRKIWTAVLNEKGLIDENKNVMADVSGKFTTVKNFETGELTTIVNAHANSSGKNYLNNADLFVSKTHKNGKNTKEYSLITSTYHNDSDTELAYRTFTKNESNPFGTITLYSPNDNKQVTMSIKEYVPDKQYINSSI